MNDSFIKKIVVTGFMSALVFLGTYLTRIEIGFCGGHIMVHLGNMFCLVAAILFGKKCGGLSGAVGMSLFDVISGRFLVYAVFIFILKYVVGFVCGYIKEKYDKRFVWQRLNVIAVLVALLINVVFSPVISFVVKFLIYDLDFYVALVSTLGSVIGVVVTSILSGVLALLLLRILEPMFSAQN